MNINNSEHIVSALSNKEIKTLIIALQRFNKSVGASNSELMCKLVDGFFLSNELESETVKPNPNAPIHSAEYKLYEAMYESDVRAHS